MNIPSKRDTMGKELGAIKENGEFKELELEIQYGKIWCERVKGEGNIL